MGGTGSRRETKESRWSGSLHPPVCLSVSMVFSTSRHSSLQTVFLFVYVCVFVYRTHKNGFSVFGQVSCCCCCFLLSVDVRRFVWVLPLCLGGVNQGSTGAESRTGRLADFFGSVYVC